MTQRYQATLFQERRIAISHQIQQAYMQKFPSIPLLITSNRSVYRRNLKNWKYTIGDEVWWNAEELYFAEEE